ncbi:hypothetical protein [Legionella spiritensis]|uniref:Dot/Icm T4SS effector n=1 Tax=Legionella spiritensis TaxID=452 RepID=A0A0W0Z6X0_LEGSP|nr:hypothetical protein [Legionella spiritensis]KTD64856.1 hypothetical protein Lspi_1023 [Legionella spiritensis]SNV40918.1 Uncharacterised protein [Legionella spiritensis]
MRSVDEHEKKIPEENIPHREDILKQIAVTAKNLRSSTRDIEDIVWPKEVMNVVLADKSFRRRIKGLPFHHMVTEFQTPLEKYEQRHEEKRTELTNFVDFLAKDDIKGRLPVGLRFQFAVLIGGHWTTIDNQVTPKGIATFCLDSVMDSRALYFFNWYRQSLREKGLLHIAYAYHVHVAQGLFDKTPKEKIANMMQTNQVSCGVFVADHLSFLSRTNVFRRLKEAVGDESLYGDEPDYISFGREYTSPALAAVFRLTQSELLLGKLSKKQAEAVISRKGKRLKDVKNEAFSKDESIPYFTTNVINKGETIMENATRFVRDSEDDTYSAIFSHSLTEELSAYAEQYSEPVNGLIALIYEKLPEFKTFSDEDQIRFMGRLHEILRNSEWSDDQKLMALLEEAIIQFAPLKDVAAYRLLTAIMADTVLHINDNRELWDFYTNFLKQPLVQGLQSNTNSFFNKPTKITPALMSYIDKAVKTQLMVNAVHDVSQGGKEQLSIVTGSEEIMSFIRKPRHFETSETRTAKWLVELVELAQEEEGPAQERALKKMEGRLAQSKRDILHQFGMDITISSDMRP